MDSGAMRYRTERGSGEAHFADPGGNAPAVIVLHEVWGMTPFIEEVCADLADLGYASFAPLLYWRNKEIFSPGNIEDAMRAVWDLPLEARFDGKRLKSKAVKAGASADALRLLSKLYDPRYRKLISADVHRLARTASRGRPSVGVIGFSMGGGFALRLAARFDRLRACVTYSAQPPDSAQLARIGSPLLSFYGSDDKFMTEHLPGFVADAIRLGKELTLRIYPAAPHEFFERNDADAYRPEFAQDAWMTTGQFLESRLRRASQR